MMYPHKAVPALTIAERLRTRSYGDLDHVAAREIDRLVAEVRRLQPAKWAEEFSVLNFLNSSETFKKFDGVKRHDASHDDEAESQLLQQQVRRWLSSLPAPRPIRWLDLQRFAYADPESAAPHPPVLQQLQPPAQETDFEPQGTLQRLFATLSEWSFRSWLALLTKLKSIHP